LPEVVAKDAQVQHEDPDLPHDRWALDVYYLAPCGRPDRWESKEKIYALVTVLPYSFQSLAGHLDVGYDCLCYAVETSNQPSRALPTEEQRLDPMGVASVLVAGSNYRLLVALVHTQCVHNEAQRGVVDDAGVLEVGKTP
jgi:hypothetical protein